MILRGRRLELLVKSLARNILKDSRAMDWGSSKEAKRWSIPSREKVGSPSGCFGAGISSFNASTVSGDILAAVLAAILGDACPSAAFGFFDTSKDLPKVLFLKLGFTVMSVVRC